MKFLRGLFEHYKTYYSYGRPLPRSAGIVGAIGYPSFYFLYTGFVPQPYESLSIRLIAGTLCLFVALQKYWPARLKPYYLAYSYWTILYCLPFFHVFMSLKNHGSIVFIADSLMAVFFLVLLTDWRNTIAMLVIGTVLGTLLYIVTTPDPTIPMDYVARLPTFILIVLGGSLFKLSEKQIQAEQLRTKTALAGSIAHEMRNPLGQLKYTLDNIERMLPTPTVSDFPQALPPQKLGALYQHLSQGKTAVNRGLQSIAMILDEVHAKPLDTANFAYFPAGKTSQKAIDEYGYETEAERSKVSVKIDNDFTFKGNETLYLFILFNLIKNALYYFKLHPQAALTITVDRPTIKVRDTGPGIPKDFLPDLFDAFQTSGKADGTGLGLAYCKRVMRAFGGDIRCASTLGEYTEFTLHFPEVSQAELKLYQQSVAQSAEASLKDKHILVVDDNAIQRQITQRILNALGCHIDEAANGQLALEQLNRAQYDLIVMDLNMPLLDGYAAAASIRAGVVLGQKDIPIVAYSSESAHMAQVKARKVGMNDFVSKPCSPVKLIEALAHTLEHAAQTLRVNVAALLAGKTVLLAEDNELNRMLLKANLQAWGMHVIEADQGYAVLEQLEEFPLPDVILMDINMPGLNGLETAQAIRSQRSAYQQIPIIALTGDSSEASLQAAYAAGINDFFTKPVETAVLCEKLGQLFLLKRDEENPASGRQMNAVPEASGIEISVPLLNAARLEEMRSIDMLDSCVPYYLAQTEIVLNRLKHSVSVQDFDALHQTLHTFLGMSGDVGATALHQLIRRIYPSVENGNWPGEEDWLAQIEALSEKTCQALREGYCTVGPLR
jgi:CheY-like chemotaxis protein